MKFNKLIHRACWLVLALILATTTPTLPQPRDRKPLLGEITSVPYRQHPRYRGVVGHWIMGEGGGTKVRDISGFGNDGTLTNMAPATDWVLGQFGPVLDFDGDTDLVNIDGVATPIGAAERTISFWFNAAVFGPGGNEVILSTDFITSAGRKFSIAAEDGAVSIGYASHKTITPKSALSTGVWYHFVIVVPIGATDTGDPINYIDGLLQSLTDESGSPQTLNTAFSDLTLGAKDDATLEYTGKIDDVRVYNRALNAAEILSLYTDPFLEFRNDPQFGFVAAAAAVRGISPFIMY